MATTTTTTQTKAPVLKPLLLPLCPILFDDEEVEAVEAVKEVERVEEIKVVEAIGTERVLAPVVDNGLVGKSMDALSPTYMPIS